MQERSLTQVKLLFFASLLLGFILGTGGADGGGYGQQIALFGYWFMHAAIGLALASLITRSLERWLLADWPAWRTLLTGGCISAMLFTPLAVLLDYAGGLLQLAGSERVPLARSLSAGQLWLEFTELALPFIGSWMLINLGYQRLAAPSTKDGSRGAIRPVPATGAPASARKPSLVSQLPSALGTDIQLIEADLNYVHVTTPAGQAMVLYSLNRAADELRDSGMLVHRSYWVAHRAVAKVRKNGGAVVILLADGKQVPVSRRRQKRVLEAYGRGYQAATAQTE